MHATRFSFFGLTSQKHKEGVSKKIEATFMIEIFNEQPLLPK